MKLEMATFTVRNVRFGERTGYDRGVLELNSDELVNVVLEDKRIVSAALEIVCPGEKTRIVKVRDAVEPRYVRELRRHLPGAGFGKGWVVRTPDEQRRHRQLPRRSPRGNSAGSEGSPAPRLPE